MSLFLLPRSVGISSKRGLIKKLQINSTFSFIATICGRALGRDMFVGPIHAIGLAPSKLSLQHEGYLTQAFWKMRVQILFRDGNNSSSEAYAIRAHLESVLNQKCASCELSFSAPTGETLHSTCILFQLYHADFFRAKPEALCLEPEPILSSSCLATQLAVLNFSATPRKFLKIMAAFGFSRGISEIKIIVQKWEEPVRFEMLARLDQPTNIQLQH